MHNILFLEVVQLYVVKSQSLGESGALIVWDISGFNMLFLFYFFHYHADIIRIFLSSLLYSTIIIVKF